MGQALMQAPKMSAPDFLEWEAMQATRHEFVDGEVFARAGAEDGHVTVILNIAMALRQHLAGTPCRTYMVDMKLNVALANSYFYPDVFVTCHPADHASRLVKSRPILIVEVLSPSTAASDRGEKFARYRLIDGLREYAVIDIDTRCTDVYRKGADGLWVLHPFDAVQAVRLDSVGVEITADALFADVDPPATPTDAA